ncbi:MAG: hypothetical protein FJX97_06535 [Bacteroidetes bacterium]|nr:hypothetical protein [Bacteroidota bacterium]
MKRLLLLLTLSFGLGSCADSEDKYYTGRSLEVDLFQASTYDYSGTVAFRELVGGSLELAVRLEGAKSNTEDSYPAHLHFGSYNQADAPIAQILNPVSSRNLASTTQLGTLSDGRNLKFDELASFDGHIKIHLANEGPDYSVILVAGNLGPKSKAGFDPNQVAVCSKTF